MALYRTKDGDVLDAICLAYYDQSQGYIEAVLNANPRLADIGPILPAGIEIELPDFPALTIANDTLRLWN